MCYLRLTNDGLMFQVKLLIQVVEFLRKTFQLFRVPLKAIIARIKSFIEDTNDFLKKQNELTDLTDEFILCIINILGLKPKIPHK